MSDSKGALATFAGGCFWCMQPPFDALDGVLSTRVGYCGGHDPAPTYETVCQGTTGHAEALEVCFDPEQISYEQLLHVFWRNIDPTTVNGQFADHGTQYRTAIFVHDAAQRAAAEASKQAMQDSGRFAGPIVTEIVDASEFFAGEDYHQAYYKSCPMRYEAYKEGSGRAPYLRRMWKE